MTKVDLHLIGNTVIDDVYRIHRCEKDHLLGTSNTYSNHYKSLGGIFNLLTVLKESKLKTYVSTHWKAQAPNPKLFNNPFEGFSGVDFYPVDDFSHALILSEGLNGGSLEKTTYVKWGDVSSFKDFKPVPATWAHISYLDVLEDLDLKPLRDSYKNISADVCLSNLSPETLEKVINNLQYIDFLFISTNEIDTYIKNLPDSCYTNLEVYEKGIVDWIFKEMKVRKGLIYHSANFHFLATPSEYKQVKLKDLISNVSVVGAGDKLAANFLIYFLTKTSDSKDISIEDLIDASRFSAEATAKVLKDYEEV
jgi:hypothetical protein